MEKGTLALTIGPNGKEELVRIINSEGLYEHYSRKGSFAQIWQDLFIYDTIYQCEYCNGTGTAWLLESQLDMANAIDVAKWKIKNNR